MKNIKKTILHATCLTALIACLLTAFTSCATTQVTVEPDATYMEIIQKAQTAYDNGKTKQSIQYYTILIQRYGMNPAVYVEGTYEIAHIYLKQKKYDLARPMYNELKAIFDQTAPGQLPGAYKKMFMHDYEKLAEHDKKHAPKNE